MDRDRLERDLRDYDRAHGIRRAKPGTAEPDDGSEWAHLARAAARVLAVMAGVALFGLAQQRWAGYYERKKSDGAAPADSWTTFHPEEAERMQAELERLRKTLAELTPEDRAMYRQFVDEFMPVVLANPDVVALGRPIKKGHRPPLFSDRAGRFVARAWVALAWLTARAWWSVWLGALAFAAWAGFWRWRDNDALARAAVEAGLAAARLWVWLLSGFCAFLFAATGRLFWPEIPLSFMLAPACMAGAFLWLGAGERLGKTWLRALELAVVPLASAGTLWGAALLL